MRHARRARYHEAGDLHGLTLGDVLNEDILEGSQEGVGVVLVRPAFSAMAAMSSVRLTDMSSLSIVDGHPCVVPLLATLRIKPWVCQVRPECRAG